MESELLSPHKMAGMRHGLEQQKTPGFENTTLLGEGSLITGRGATKREGGGKGCFTPTKRGDVKVLAMLKGGGGSSTSFEVVSAW